MIEPSSRDSRGAGTSASSMNILFGHRGLLRAGTSTAYLHERHAPGISLRKRDVCDHHLRANIEDERVNLIVRCPLRPVRRTGVERVASAYCGRRGADRAHHQSGRCGLHAAHDASRADQRRCDDHRQLRPGGADGGQPLRFLSRTPWRTHSGGVWLGGSPIGSVPWAGTGSGSPSGGKDGSGSTSGLGMCSR